MTKKTKDDDLIITNQGVFNIKKILKSGVIFDIDNEPIIINGIAQRDIKSGEYLYYYGKVRPFFRTIN